MKYPRKSWLLWLTGFICGVVGAITDLTILYFLGLAAAITGILFIHVNAKDKKVWQLLVNLIGLTP